MTWVKICGTTNLQDGQQSVAAGADALGFIFAESPRRASIETAAAIVAALPHEVEAIGVFVNESPEHVAEIAQGAGLRGVQLHGDEAAEQLPEFRRALGERKIIKALHARELIDSSHDVLTRYLARRASIDAILLDAGSPDQRGGTGVPFAWEKALPVAAAIRDAMPLIIAGGLTPENVAAAIELFQPYGVDVVSGVEIAAGRKHEARLREFVAAARHARVSLKQRA